MIRRLEIENFYSIREPQVIDLTIGAGVAEGEERFGRLLDRKSGPLVPRTVVIFGANASGKSTVLKALGFLGWFLTSSWELSPAASLPIERFADGNEQPTRIKVCFDWIGDLSVSDAIGPRTEQYTYELIVGTAPGYRSAVLYEELRLQPDAGKSRRLFERDADGNVQGGSGFSMKGAGRFLSSLRPNVSATATMAKNTGRSPISGLYSWAKSIQSNIPIAGEPQGESRAIQYYVENGTEILPLNSALGRLDTGIQYMNILSTAEGPRPVFTHYGLNISLPLGAESEGTRQFFRIYPILWEALRTGGMAVVDELDSAIHPMIMPSILRWFYDQSVNAWPAQLWMCGHNASVFEDLRKEEIFLTEKDGDGRTRLYGLKDIEGVRRVDNFYQKYLGGVYGAVPRIG